MTSQRFGVAVAGTGVMGRRMLEALRTHPRFRIVAAWDPDRTALVTALRDMPTTRPADDLADLVQDPAVDLVYIAAPPNAHDAIVAATIAAGRAALCEKPLAADVDQARSLRDRVASASMPFAVNFPFASLPASRRLVSAVRDGSLGRIDSAAIVARFAAWPRPWQAGAGSWLSGAAEGGFTREVLSHFVFLALRAFGPATVVDARLTRDPGRVETALTARLVHHDVTVTIDAAIAGDVADRNRFDVVGTRGAVALVDWSRFEQDGAVSERVDASPLMLDRLARMLEGHDDHELATADEGLEVVRCIETMLQA